MKSKFILLFTISLFFLACKQSEETKENLWKQNSKECFCGIEFKGSKIIESIDMKIKTITILNCDGTYISKQDWGTSKENEDTYRSTTGSSKGSNYDFHGTWQIIEPTSGLRADGSMDKFKPTYIKFICSDGKVGLGYICVFRSESTPSVGALELVINDMDGNYAEGEKVGMFEGDADSDMKLYGPDGKEIKY